MNNGYLLQHTRLLVDESLTGDLAFITTKHLYTFRLFGQTVGEQRRLSSL